MKLFNTKKILWLIPFLCFASGYFVPYFFLKKETYATPNIIGKSVHIGLKTLSELHINSRVVSYKEDPTLPAGTIVNQIPTPGQKIKTHQTIFLTVSLEPSPLLTEYYNGQIVTVEQEAQLKKAGIRYKKVPVYSYLPEETCIAQYPAFKTPNKEKKLILYTAYNNTLMIFPNFIHQPAHSVITLLNKHNIPYKIISIEPESDITKSHIVEQRPLPGSFINLNNPGLVTLKIH